MRPIHVAKVDKSRPVVMLTREAARPYMTRVTVAPITSTVRGLSTEVRVGAINGLEDESVVSLDNVATINQSDIGRLVGHLDGEQELALAHALIAAYDLDV